MKSKHRSHAIQENKEELKDSMFEFEDNQAPLSIHQQLAARISKQQQDDPNRDALL
jgi:hypothetical protein